MNKNKNLPQNSETHAASLLVPPERRFIIPESELNMPYSLTDEHIRFFEENGFVMLRKVFNKETVAAILQVIGPLMDQRVQEMPPEAQRDISGRAASGAWCGILA